MALNMLLGRINQKGGLRIIPWADPVVSGAPRRDEVLDNDLVAYLVNVAASREKAPAVMLVHDANPAYALPGAAAMSEVLRKSAFLVSFSPFMDETAAMADLVLPSSYAFEAFDDSYTPFGGPLASYRAAAPIIEPVHDTRPMPDVLLGLASELGFDLGHSSFEEVIQARAEQLGADFSALTEEGETWVSEGSAFQFFLSLWKEPMSADLGRTQAGGQLVLAPVTRLNIGSPGTATPPFNVLTISERELQGRECFVAMNRATASMLKVGQGDKVRISSQAGAMEARVRLFEGVAPGAVSASLGFGHTAWDEFSQGKGANAFDLFTVQGTDALGGTAFGNPQISVSRV
jgi:anaerobic selenocysteine-containing dehydrogenase